MREFQTERGSATIEATISLTMFVFVIMAIYMLVNFCIVQAKVAYAINTTAKEMSQYAYFYHTLGLDSLDERLKQKKQQAIQAYDGISSLIDGTRTELKELNKAPSDYLVEALEGSKDDDFEQLSADIQNVESIVKNVVNNPAEFMKSLGAIAGEGVFTKVKSHLVAAPLAKGMTRRHFGNSAKSANEYLESLGVVEGYDGINFNMSTMFAHDSPQDIQIVAVYKLDLAVFFPFELDVTIQQTSSARAWLGGDLKLVEK